MLIRLPENMFVFSKSFRSYVSLVDCITKAAPEDKELTERNSSYEKLSLVQREILHPTPKKYKLPNEEEKERHQEQDTEDDDSENFSQYDTSETESTDNDSTESEFSDTDSDNHYPEFHK